MKKSQRLRIFVSYRREDTEGMAGRLSDRLATRPDVDEVFMDVDVIHAGTDYRKQITAALGRCNVLFALIGRDWLTVVDGNGSRRLDDPDDLLVFEIESALDRGVIVVPVLVDKARVPRKADLPPRIASLVDLHAATLDHESFHRDVEALHRDVAALQPKVEDGSTDGSGPGPQWYPGAFLALAGILLVFAALRFAILARTLTGADQVADAVAATAVGVVGLGLLLPLERSGAAWEGAAGVFLGVSPFVTARMWWSAELRSAVPPLVMESPLWMILAALGIVLVLVARSAGGFGRPRLRDNAAFASGIAAAVGLVAIGSVLPTTDDDLATLRLSDPILLLASAALAVVAITTRGMVQNAVLAGWACGLCYVTANTVWLLRHTEFGLSGRILGTHLALSFLAVIVVVTTVALRRRVAPRGWPTPGSPHQPEL